MNYNTIFKILLILTIISTLCICIIKPKMHTSMLIYDSSYKIVETTPEQEPTVNMPTMTQKPQVETKSTTLETKTKQVENTTKTEPIKVQKIKVVTQPKTTIKQNTPKSHQMTVQEEEIAWNKWRSRLQNQIMRDTTLPPIPQGTVFKFTFDVDLYGKISNIQTWAIPSTFTPYAIQYIAPVIKSYQGRSILIFPTGTERTTTNVNGGWKIATQARYSTPQDYNDTEKVIK